MSDITTKTKCRCGIELGDHNTIDLLYCLMNGIKLFDTLSEINKKNVADLRQAESERDRLREAASEYQEAASDALYGQGDKEDSASAYDKADEQLTAALAAVPEDESDVVESSYNEWFRMHQNDVAVPEERKPESMAALDKMTPAVCNWRWDKKAKGYRTPHGQLDTSGWNVKGAQCSVCGLPIVEKPGKEGT